MEKQELHGLLITIEVWRERAFESIEKEDFAACMEALVRIEMAARVGSLELLQQKRQNRQETKE